MLLHVSTPPSSSGSAFSPRPSRDGIGGALHQVGTSLHPSSLLPLACNAPPSARPRPTRLCSRRCHRSLRDSHVCCDTTRPGPRPPHSSVALRPRQASSPSCLSDLLERTNPCPHSHSAAHDGPDEARSSRWVTPVNRTCDPTRSLRTQSALCDCVRDVQKQARRFSCMHASDHAHTLIMPSLNNVRACAEIFHLFSRSPSLLVAPATPPSRRTPSGRCRVPRQRAYMSPPLLRPVRCLLVS
jgi:hypothetical protein